MRRDFSQKVKATAALRADGQCENCTRRLAVGDFHFDHRIPDALGGEPTLANCQVLCKACHTVKTSESDAPNISKAKRRERARFGIRKPRTITRWRRFDGTPVFAGRDR